MSGSVALSLLVWLGCGVYSLLDALCYIELGLLLPEAGGDYVYLLRGLGPLHHFFGPLPAFLSAWMDTLIMHPALVAILSLAFAEYCVQPFFGAPCSPAPLGVSLVAVVTYCFVVFINCYSVAWATRVQNLFTVAKLTSIGIILVAGAYSLAQGNSQHLATGFQGTTSSPGDVASAFYTGLFSYGGWQLLNTLTEEMVRPERNLPLAILVAVPVVTVCYILTNVAYLTVLSPQQLLDSSAVAFSFGERALGPVAFLMPLGVALSLFGTLNGATLGTCRVTFAAARQGHLVDMLGFVHVRRRTPIPALIFNAIIGCIMITVGSIGALMRMLSFVSSLFRALTMVSLLVMRRTRADARRPYRVPTAIPCLLLLSSCYLFVSSIVDRPKTEYLYGLAFLLVGVGVHAAIVYQRMPTFGGRVIACFQKALQVVPTT
ncbi:b(0,+)-type amino acid transporter 1-like [Pollicipes pollicipes]|nr:b(0,+)-type amino acid transporter 1-like [Pollicipes pollicipes]